MSCSKCGPESGAGKSDCGGGTQKVGLRSSKTDNKAQTVLLLGNPNIGKSTLFNAVTGAHQRVINAPGTTVEVFAGTWRSLGVRIIDMPGTYSLLPTSPDEEVVVDTMAAVPGSLTDPELGRRADLVVCFLDATAITRSLYILAQAAQTGLPLIAAVTMQDIADAEGEAIDTAALEKVLGIPVVVVDPRNKRGLGPLTDTVRLALETQPRITTLPVDPAAPGFNPTAAKKLRQLHEDNGCGAGCNCAKEELPQLAHDGEDDEMSRAARLFDWIEDVEQKVGKLTAAPEHRSSSDKVDKVLLNPVFGVPIFFLALYIMFWLANNFATVFQDPIENFFHGDDGFDFTIADKVLFHGPSLSQGVSALLAGTTWSGGAVESFLNNGLLTGIGVVASFAPLMIVMFIAIALMEDSGYMARVAFLGDRIMRKIGLDGRVIMPFVVGFGCNLPAMAAMRTIPNSRQRLLAILLTPYISCNARLVVYMLIARIFFPNWADLVVLSMYIISIVMVILGGLILKPFIMKGSAGAPLLLVLPPYQIPRVLITLKSGAQRTWSFLTGAGKVIVAMSCIVWLLLATPVSGSADLRFGTDVPVENSAYGTVAGALAPAFKPAGFDDWHISGALIAGFVAKESMISTLATSYAGDQGECNEEEKALFDEYNEKSDNDIKDELSGDAEKLKAVNAALAKDCGGVHLGQSEESGEPSNAMSTLLDKTFTKTTGSPALAPWAAYAFLIFVLTYTPCLATVAEQVRQVGKRWALSAVVFQLVAAWVLAVVVFQIGRLFV